MLPFHSHWSFEIITCLKAIAHLFVTHSIHFLCKQYIISSATTPKEKKIDHPEKSLDFSWNKNTHSEKIDRWLISSLYLAIVLPKLNSYFPCTTFSSYPTFKCKSNHCLFSTTPKNKPSLSTYLPRE